MTGLGTLGAAVHALPFLIPDYSAAMTVGVIVVAAELLTIAWIRWRWFPATSVGSSIAQVTLAGIVVFAVGIGVRRHLAPSPPATPRPAPHR